MEYTAQGLTLEPCQCPTVGGNSLIPGNMPMIGRTGMGAWNVTGELLSRARVGRILRQRQITQRLVTLVHKAVLQKCSLGCKTDAERKEGKD